MAANLATHLGGTQYPSDPGTAAEMVDFVVDRARRRRAEEPAEWP
jgi:adenylosuccinate lyase